MVTPWELTEDEKFLRWTMWSPLRLTPQVTDRAQGHMEKRRNCRQWNLNSPPSCLQENIDDKDKNKTLLYLSAIIYIHTHCSCSTPMTTLESLLAFSGNVVFFLMLAGCSSPTNKTYFFPLVMEILVISRFLWTCTQRAAVIGSRYIYRVLAVPHTPKSLSLLLPCLSTIL